jgi:hypothetical protein
MTLYAAVLPNVASDFMAGAISAIEGQAKARGIDLAIKVDPNPITETYNEAHSMVYPDCTGTSCYDMIIADYFHAPARSVNATFAPSFLSPYLTTFILEGGQHMSFDEADRAGGNICLRQGTAENKDVLEEIATNGMSFRANRKD